MKYAVTLLVFLFTSTLAFPQDVRLREEAVRLLERAHAVSLPPNLPNLERTVTFQVQDSPASEGTFTRVVVQGTGRRDEITFGDYHVVDVWTRGQLATIRTGELAPPEVQDALRLTPMLLVRFDHEDVIRAITERSVGGHSLRCIQFDTVAGNKSESNELCMDSATGTLVSEKLGNRLVENSDFFSFAGALIPGKIRYSYAGVPKLELSQTMTELIDPTPNVLAAPPNAQIRRFCTTFRRPLGQSMPQPKPGNGVQDFEVAVRGIIGMDGRVHDAVVQSSEQPDLNEEALSLIQQWVFTPAVCDGKPNTTEATFTLHFQGR
jgi:TonB family protein